MVGQGQAALLYQKGQNIPFRSSRHGQIQHGARGRGLHTGPSCRGVGRIIVGVGLLFGRDPNGTTFLLDQPLDTVQGSSHDGTMDWEHGFLMNVGKTSSQIDIALYNLYI